jgi:hypothetical protein
MIGARLLLCLAVAVAAGGCRARDVERDLRLTGVRTGWYDAGVVDGQNKLVPSVSFTIENVSAAAIRDVQLNAVFRRVHEPETAWGDELVRAIGDEALDAGAASDPLVIRSRLGYTGVEPRLQMLENSAFVDATVEIFGAHRSRAWVKIGEYAIDRELITE